MRFRWKRSAFSIVVVWTIGKNASKSMRFQAVENADVINLNTEPCRISVDGENGGAREMWEK